MSSLQLSGYRRTEHRWGRGRWARLGMIWRRPPSS